MINVSILTIGDEICIGQVINSNAAWIAEQCSRLGCKVYYHSTVGDEKQIMLSELEHHIQTSDIVIITGGLGPTSDDITKPVLTEFFNDTLIIHESSLKYIEEILQKRGIRLTERNKTVAMLPSKCIPLSNRVGTAPGMLFNHNGKYIFSLPGVPAEMKYIMETHVLPFIQEKIKESKSGVVLYKTLQTIGIVESMLADLIGEPEDYPDLDSLAFLPSYKGVKLRIGVTADDFDSAKAKIDAIENTIRDKAGKYIFATGEESINQTIGNLLKERKYTLAVAESCTGGMLGAAITDIAGSSDYFLGGAIVYSNEAKMNILGIDKDTLEENGAVSEQIAIGLAKNVREIFNSDYGISITGIAGPTGGTEEKPVGTVWLGFADRNGAEAKKYLFGQDRAVNRERSVGTALGLIYKKLMNSE